jgi:hypothetical protein
MVGQHPQMFGLPETHLFGYETMAGWWKRCAEAPWGMSTGLLRVVAELYFGGQTERTVRRASGWLRRRLHLSTGALMESLAHRVAPLLLVDKSPSVVWQMEWLHRAFTMFPSARFIHLLRHPRAHGESVLKYVAECKVLTRSPGRRPQWLIDLAAFPAAPPAPGEAAEPPLSAGSFDPQWGWYQLNRNIVDFLAEVPAKQVFRLRGEDVLTDPDRALRPLCGWLGVRDDEEAIAEMKHPERSPFACIGPRGAPGGMDIFFLKSPALRPSRAEPKSLEGPLPWRSDGRGFAPAVRWLAQELGYT